jgi:hypothetical protein
MFTDISVEKARSDMLKCIATMSDQTLAMLLAERIALFLHRTRYDLRKRLQTLASICLRRAKIDFKYGLVSIAVKSSSSETAGAFFMGSAREDSRSRHQSRRRF